jgi:hypothetical protein
MRALHCDIRTHAGVHCTAIIGRRRAQTNNGDLSLADGRGTVYNSLCSTPRSAIAEGLRHPSALALIVAQRIVYVAGACAKPATGACAMR